MSAGILIGLLSLKPQLGIFFPRHADSVGTLAHFCSAAVTTIAIAAATAILFGPQVWIDFVQNGLPIQNLVLADPERIATPFYPTIFMNLRGTGAGYALAMAVQACFAAFTIAPCSGPIGSARPPIRNCSPRCFSPARWRPCPYLLSYDVLPLTFAAVLLLATGKLDATGRRLAQLVFWLPRSSSCSGSSIFPARR